MTDQETTILMAKAKSISNTMWKYFKNKDTCLYLEKCDLEGEAIVKYLEKYAGKCPDNVKLGAYVYTRVRRVVGHMLEKEVNRIRILKEKYKKVF